VVAQNNTPAPGPPKVDMTAQQSIRDRTPAPADATATRRLIFSTLSGLAGLAILLQGLWAGEFLQYHGTATQTQRDSWINVHARGGEVAIVLALIATIWALLRLRSRLDLLIGSAVLSVLLIAVAYVGGLISENNMDNLIPLHIPLALATLALAVWVTWQGLRARRTDH
jgi:heme A synthase